MKIRTFSIPEYTRTFNPPAINAEPTKPPMSAWLLEEGRPKYQVIKSQTIAPIRPAKITSTVAISGLIIPFPTVVAIAVPNTNGPTKLAAVAMLTAYNGLRTLVPTTVAMALAES